MAVTATCKDQSHAWMRGEGSESGAVAYLLYFVPKNSALKYTAMIPTSKATNWKSRTGMMHSRSSPQMSELSADVNAETVLAARTARFCKRNGIDDSNDLPPPNRFVKNISQDNHSSSGRSRTGSFQNLLQRSHSVPDLMESCSAKMKDETFIKALRMVRSILSISEH